MKPVSKKGQLKKWIDDRGFGFIKPDEGGKDVFLHISAVKRASRRPQVGDTIFYEQITEPDGKIRATKAAIQGVTLPYQPKQRKKTKRQYLTGVIGITISIAIVFVVEQLSSRNSPSPVTSVTKIFGSKAPSCLAERSLAPYGGAGSRRLRTALC